MKARCFMTIKEFDQSVIEIEPKDVTSNHMKSNFSCFFSAPNNDNPLNVDAAQKWNNKAGNVM